MKRNRLLRRLSQSALLVCIGILLLWSLQMAGFWKEEWIQYWPEFTEALTQYFPPALYFDLIPFVDVGRYYQFWVEEGLVGEAGITLAIALAGTIVGAPLALLFGILGNERVTPFPFNFLFRGVMSIIRSIPSLVWALIYVPLGGISPVTATLAIGTDTIGELGRLLTDELEEIDDGPIEGIRSTGASKPQVITFGMITQIVRPFIAWAMFILENNVRSAVGLGIIGAGGLGVTLSIEQQTFKFTNMMATILFIVVLVLSVEMISQRTRSYLRGDDDEEQLSLYELIVGFPERMSKSLLK
ncbi:phosphonate ABC transporter, permease protein PhnE [Halorientalis pallida]|uniref:Phosphonate ABC transporter, permease protein PhnE n=1 Tax=Halorientalis pallida TaxID=2479928 RepID=A0A498KTM9_9EURY|nr:phosphonate ABC transporter, permease protein PhnE [Halorientalis pallida]